jgi:hypothetical protein
MTLRRAIYATSLWRQGGMAIHVRPARIASSVMVSRLPLDLTYPTAFLRANWL